MSTLKGSMRMMRTSCNVEEDYLSIEVEDELSGIQFLKVKMPLGSMADLLTSRTAECEFEARAWHNVGKKRETKREKVFIPGNIYDLKKRLEAADEAVKKFNVDGWRGDVRDAVNHHNRCAKGVEDGVDGEYYSVRFTRFVEVEHE